MPRGTPPQAEYDNMPPAVIKEIVEEVKTIYELPRPKTDDEVEARVKWYFEFCKKTQHRAGTESLCLALHINRQTLYNWSSGIGCSERRAHIAARARQALISHLEESTLRGKLSPPVAIFMLKNVAGYRDVVEISQEENAAKLQQMQSSTEIAARYANAEKPQLLDTNAETPQFHSEQKHIKS